MTKITWKEFREAGMLWWGNRFLHLFGLAIVVDIDDSNGEIVGVYPAKCKYRGFPLDAEKQGFKDVTGYLKENIGKIEGEINE